MQVKKDTATFVGTWDFLLSKLAMLQKEKFDEATGKFKLKSRFGMDGASTGVSRCAGKGFKSVLPRPSDAADDVLTAIDNVEKYYVGPVVKPPDVAVEQAVVDASYAFWHTPLSPAGRRFFVAKVCVLFYVFLKTAQRSRGGPLAWAVIFGLACRLALSTCKTFDEASGYIAAFLEVYVDDPIFILCGSKKHRGENIVSIFLALIAPEVPLQFGKAQRGREITWIGCNIKIDVSQVTLYVTSERMK